MNRPASLVTGIFLILIAIAQLCRVILGVNVVAAGVEIPIWPSAVAFIFLIFLALWLLAERKK
jgi:hypothetical protein